MRRGAWRENPAGRRNTPGLVRCVEVVAVAEPSLRRLRIGRRHPGEGERDGDAGDGVGGEATLRRELAGPSRAGLDVGALPVGQSHLKCATGLGADETGAGVLAAPDQP